MRGLIHTLSHYKFTITENTPIEEEIALDPELLGMVFENLLAAYNPETGITARKQTGSFNTPREVVNYMVDESLIAHLKAKLETVLPNAKKVEARLRHLFAYNEQPHQFEPQEVSVLIQAVDDLKVLDPACGSGAFPMGILHKLVFVLGKLDPDNSRWRGVQQQRALRETEDAYKIGDHEERKTRLLEIEDTFERNTSDYGRKLYLIQNCIFGVDIQPVAAQISKLRFFISLVVDQKVDRNAPNLGVRALPNLETKFVAANTLLRVRGLGQQMLTNLKIAAKENELREVRKRHFNSRTLTTKKTCRAQDAALRNEIAQLLRNDGWNKETATKLAAWDPYDQNRAAAFFDPEWMFGLREGFDIVIANPPYVRQEEIKEFKPYFEDAYECFTGTADLYVYFYECGFRLLKPASDASSGGLLCYISSNKYFRSAYGEKLRNYLGQKARILELIDFGDAPVFTAIAYPSIILACKHKPGPEPAEGVARVMTWQPGPPIEDFPAIFKAKSFTLPQKELKADGWRLECPAVLRLLDKLRKVGKPLGEYVNNRFYRGILTGLNEAFVVDRTTRDRLIAEHKSSAQLLKPFLRGRDVKRWRVEFAEHYLIKIESSENKDHPWSGKPQKEAERIFAATCPAIHAHFQGFRAGLIQRDDQGKYFWELRSCSYWEEFEKPKIVIPAISRTVEYALDSEGYYTNDKTSIIVTSDLSYILAILNSSVLWWFIKQTAASKQGGFFEFKPMYVALLPIPPAGISERTAITELADKIIAAREKGPDADVSGAEREIDRLVYALYGLTPEEIALVEGSGA